MWILWKMRFWKCELCEKWDFEYVNFVKNEISKCEFCEKWDFEKVNFVKKWYSHNVNFWWITDFCSSLFQVSIYLVQITCMSIVHKKMHSKVNVVIKRSIERILEKDWWFAPRWSSHPNRWFGVNGRFVRTRNSLFFRCWSRLSWWWFFWLLGISWFSDRLFIHCRLFRFVINFHVLFRPCHGDFFHQSGRFIGQNSFIDVRRIRRILDKMVMVRFFESLEHAGGKNPLFIQKFPWFWYFKHVNFVENEISERWILWKMRFQKCEFCE